MIENALTGGTDGRADPAPIDVSAAAQVVGEFAVLDGLFDLTTLPSAGPPVGMISSSSSSGIDTGLSTPAGLAATNSRSQDLVYRKKEWFVTPEA